MSSPLDSMLGEESIEQRPHVPGSVPPIARRIYPIGYVPEDGEVVPTGVIPKVTPPVASVIAPPVVAPVVAPTPVPTEFVEVEEWQATNESGEPVGPPSKIYGRGPTLEAALRALAHNLRDANIKAARKIKEYRDKYRTHDQEKVSTTFEPQPLTAEDRVKIARLLADPATVEDGYALLYQAQFGESPEQVRERHSRQQEANWVVIGRQETDKFLSEHPDFPVGPVAKKLLLDEVQTRKNAALADGNTFGWTAHNLEIVYDDLVDRGLLSPQQPDSISEPTTQRQIAPSVRASQESIPQVVTPANPPTPVANTTEEPGTRPRGTRFSVMSTEHGQSPQTVSRQAEDEAFRKEVNDMPIDTLKRRIKSDRKFNERLNSLGR